VLWGDESKNGEAKGGKQAGRVLGSRRNRPPCLYGVPVCHSRVKVYIAQMSMLDAASFQYVLENTEVILAPERRIETFGSTSFRFYLVTELMDEVNAVRVRDGRLHADRPQIIAPGHLQRLLLDGFGERAEQYMNWLQQHSGHLAVLKYGFQFRKTDVSESIVHSPMGEVIDRIRDQIDYSEDPLSAIIQGIDEGWEISLLKFASDLIQESSGSNVGEFRRRGLL